MVQALAQVRRVADTGQANAAILATAMDSVFRIEAPSPIAVYGDVESVRPGLTLLRDYFGNQQRDEQLPPRWCRRRCSWSAASSVTTTWPGGSRPASAPSPAMPSAWARAIPTS